jgi:hypothetical protein
MYAKFWGIALLFASTMVAQTDWAGFAAGLRSKYGPSLLRDTFVPRPGVEMAVDYAANGNVCRIQLPPIVPDDFLTELIPASMRGKELRGAMMQFGQISVKFTEYENVTISESFNATGRTGVTVSFPNEQCRDKVQ